MKKITKILTLSLASLSLFACDDIVAEPTDVINGTNIVVFENGTTAYYDNDYSVIYDQLVDSGTSNATIEKELLRIIANKEVSAFYDLSEDEFKTVLNNVKLSLAGKQVTAVDKAGAATLETIITKYVKDKLIEKVKGGSYSIDNLFYEEKLVNELKSALYVVEGTDYNADYLITPDSTYEEIFNCDYSDYIERSIYPDLLKELLTSVYLYNNEYTSLGRADAREVQYIKIPTIDSHKDSVSVLIDKYFETFVEEGASALPTGTFDLDSLARIYKGVYDDEELLDTTSVSYKENKFAEENGIFTREDVLVEELEKVIDGNGNILPDNDPNRSEELVNSYTGSYSYPVSHGKELKDRELATLDIVVDEDDLVLSSNGIAELPSDLRDRLFSPSIDRNTTTVTSSDNASVKLLLPKSTPTDSTSNYLTKYSYYQDNAYYIVVVGNSYDTSDLATGRPDMENVDETVKNKALEIARILAQTSNNQKDAILYYFDQYGMEFGDQNFYDYIESAYPDVLEDE